MNQPKGKITIQTLAMPADTNANGDIFGGWLVSQMDLAGGVLAKQTSKGRVATVAIQSMEFLKPVRVGDIVSCHVALDKVGRTSMTMNIEVWAHSEDGTRSEKVTDGTFIYVAIDSHGHPRPVY